MFGLIEMAGMTALVLVLGVVYIWRSGKLGKENEDKVKAEIRELRGEAAAKLAKLAARSEPIEIAVDRAMAAGKTKAERIAENAALLAAGTITQTQYDAAVAKILEA